jgi:predicted amidophosphoribosyltransferase
VLVDDILTTGATLADAARALRVTGFDVVGAVVIAAVVHPVGGFGRDRPGVSA